MEVDPDVHCIGGWVGTRSILDGVEKRKFLTLPRLELRHFGRPDRSQSLYRLYKLEYNFTIYEKQDLAAI
jgi:hypothetical protein